MLGRKYERLGTADGALFRVSGENLLIRAVGRLSFGSADCFVVVDGLTNDVQVYNGLGEVTEEIVLKDIVNNTRLRVIDSVTWAPDGMFLCDMRNGAVSLCNLESMLLVGEYGGAAPGARQGELDQPCCVVSTSFGHVIVVEKGNHRLQSFLRDGQSVGVFSEFGDKPGQLRYPTSASWHRGDLTDEYMSLPLVQEPGDETDRDHPSWLRAADDSDTDETLRRELDGQELGSFLVRRMNDRMYVLTWLLNYAGDLKHRTIRKTIAGQFYAPEFGDGAKMYPALVALLQDTPELIDNADTRPVSRVAVADPENKRVQIFGYRHRAGDGFAPSMVLQCVLGTSSGTPMVCPADVAYSACGDLAVADSSTKTVWIFSPEYAVLSQLTPTNAVVGPDINFRPCCVAFTGQGGLAIGHKSKAIEVYHPPKQGRVGSLGRWPMPLWRRVTDLLVYDDACTLRGVCHFLHDFTLEDRKQWRLAPMSRYRLRQAKFAFVRWSRMPDGRPFYEPGDVVDKYDQRVCPLMLHAHAADAFGWGDPRTMGNCPRNNCVYSHRSPVIDEERIARDRPVMNFERDLCSAISATVGAKYCWEKEPRLRIAFNSMSFLIEMEGRSDPMTRECEVIRQPEWYTDRCIEYAAFLEIMTCIEEDRLGLRPWEEHPLFRASRPRGIRSGAVAVPKDIVADPLEQYQDVSIQYSKLRVRGMRRREMYHTPPVEVRLKEGRRRRRSVIVESSKMKGVRDKADLVEMAREPDEEANLARRNFRGRPPKQRGRELQLEEELSQHAEELERQKRRSGLVSDQRRSIMDQAKAAEVAASRTAEEIAAAALADAATTEEEKEKERAEAVRIEQERYNCRLQDHLDLFHYETDRAVKLMDSLFK